MTVHRPPGAYATGAQTPLPLSGNVRGPSSVTRGQPVQGFAQADVIVEGEYRTQVQTHCCMEPHGLVADWRTDGLTVYISTQSTAGVRHELAQAFGLLPRLRPHPATSSLLSLYLSASVLSLDSTVVSFGRSGSEQLSDRRGPDAASPAGGCLSAQLTRSASISRYCSKRRVTRIASSRKPLHKSLF